MAGSNPLPQLRKLRDEIRRKEALIEDRDRLIREAVDLGYSQQQIAIAAGLSQSRVAEIVTGRR